MKIEAKHVWKGLFFITTVALLWTGSSFLAKMIMLQRFSEKAEGTTTYWGVLSLEEEKHYVCADYTFTIPSGYFCAQYMFRTPVYKTKEAAESAIETMRKEKVTVWYWNKGQGEPVSILEHNFPVKEGVQVGLAAALLLYFYGLKRYLQRFASVDKKLAPSRS